MQAIGRFHNNEPTHFAVASRVAVAPLARLSRRKRAFNQMNADTWEDCTLDELLWMEQNGSYGQRMIAKRYLDDKRRHFLQLAVQADLQGNQVEADRCRAFVKNLGL